MWLVIFLILAFVRNCFAGFDQGGGGSRANALGGAFTALAGGVWSLSYNVAGLSTLRQSEVSFFYSPSPFGLPELSTEAAVLGVPTKCGVIGVAARKFGHELYQELTGTISYANSVASSGASAGVGISLNYQSASIRRYGSSGALTADLGFRIDLPGGLECGLSVRNATAAALGASGEPLPQICAVGIAYHPAHDVLLACDVRKEAGYKPGVGYGFEYWFVGAMALRAGVSDAASSYTAGIGIQAAPLRIDYDVTAHQELGWTHEATLSFFWGGKQ